MDDFREEGEGVAKSLASELKKVQTREDLITVQHELEALFTRLADVMLKADRYRQTHQTPDDPIGDLSSSDTLREELNRVCQIDGGRTIILEAQKEALHRLKPKS